MTDCIQSTNDSFHIAGVEPDTKNRLGIVGAWFVGEGRDYFQPWTDGEFEGYKISNCTGSFILARRLMLDKNGVTAKSTIATTVSTKQPHEIKDLCQNCGTVFCVGAMIELSPCVCPECYYGSEK